MSYHRLIGAAFLLTAFIALPCLDAWAQDKKKGKAPPTVADSAKLPAGEYVGILKSTPGTDRMFSIEVEQVRLVATGKGGAPTRGGGNQGINRVMQLQNQMGQAQRQLAMARTPQARNQAMNRLRTLNNQLNQAIVQLQRGGGKAGGPPPGYRYEKAKVAIEFQASEKVKVRTMLLPGEFDDKGERKKYSKKELDELKGKDKKLPGYESALERLEVGQKVQVVTVSVAVKKGATKEEKERDEEMVDDKAKQAKLIVTLEAAPPSTGKGGPKKKK